MKPATDKDLQQLVINMQTADIQAAIDQAFDCDQSVDCSDVPLIRREVARGRAPIMCNDVLILPARKKA